MSKARKNSTAVSLTHQELQRLRDLYQAAWGGYYHPDKTVDKLDKALGRISDQQQYAARNG